MLPRGQSTAGTTLAIGDPLRMNIFDVLTPTAHNSGSTKLQSLDGEVFRGCQGRHQASNQKLEESRETSSIATLGCRAGSFLRPE